MAVGFAKRGPKKPTFERYSSSPATSAYWQREVASADGNVIATMDWTWKQNLLEPNRIVF